MKPKSIIAQAVVELHGRCESALDRYIETHERRMAREGLVNEVLDVLHQQGFDKVAQSIAAQLIVDKHIKKRSDIRLPSMKQLSIFGSEADVREAVALYVFESGDGSVTKLRDMQPTDFDELDRRRLEHARKALEAATEGVEMSRAILPYQLHGMNAEDAIVAVWEALRELEGNAAVVQP